MICIFCYDSLILNLNPKIQSKKGLIIYNTTNDIITLRKHVNVNHYIISLLQNVGVIH
jgi:beta-lactamase class A